MSSGLKGMLGRVGVANAQVRSARHLYTFTYLERTHTLLIQEQLHLCSP